MCKQSETKFNICLHPITFTAARVPFLAQHDIASYLFKQTSHCDKNAADTGGHRLGLVHRANGKGRNISVMSRWILPAVQCIPEWTKPGYFPAAGHVTWASWCVRLKAAYPWAWNHNTNTPPPSLSRSGNSSEHRGYTGTGPCLPSGNRARVSSGAFG